MLNHRTNWGTIGYLVEMLGLTLWVGGLVVIIGVVIPAVFNSMGIESGGRFLRRVFDGYGFLTLGILAVLLLIAGLRYRSYHPGWHSLFSVSRGEWILLTGMLLVTASILGVLSPRAVALQELAFHAESKPEKDAAYADFFRLHMVVRALHLINLGMAATLLILKLRRTVVSGIASGFEPGGSATPVSRTGRDSE